MLRLFRMYRYCALIKQLGDKQNLDKTLVTLIGKEDRFSVGKVDCSVEFENRLRFARDKESVTALTLEECIANNFIIYEGNEKMKLALTRTNGGGADLAEGYFIGFVRELLKREWRFFTIVLPFVTFLIGLWVNNGKQ